MKAWSTYQNRIKAHGGTKRSAAHIREVRLIESRLPDNLSYKTVSIYPCEYSYNIQASPSIDNCTSQEVAIIDSDNLSEKIIYSMPGEDIALGSLVLWKSNYWIVSERDANTTLYTKAKLLQCNHLLRWIVDSEIIEQWCVVEDGTKYLVGESENRDFTATRGDTRISLQIAKNKYTNAFNRENRFLIDDDDSPHKLAYQLTKPYKKGYVFNGKGSYKFILQEVTATEYDNHKLGIADYYRYFSKKNTDSNNKGEDIKNEKRGWI